MRLRVLTYNVHKCVGGLDRRYDPERVAETIRHHEPDVVLLQEVAENAPRFRGERQLERLGDLCGFRHRAYAINVRHPRRGDYGNAILSRFPLLAWENIDVTLPRRKARSVLHGRLRVRVGRRTRTLHVFDLHLGLAESERRRQLASFLERDPFARLDPRTPVVVAGDFNDLYGSLGTRLLAPAGFRGPRRGPLTFPAWAPVRPLDSLWVSGDLRLEELARSRCATARTASDHLPLVADLEITSGRRRRR
jgi:endonuclease/exonuclease/phosphatase family metal-dependent hydrolase